MYFISEIRVELPVDMMKLVKLDMIKDQTIANLTREIRKTEEKIRAAKTSEDIEAKKKFNTVEKEMRVNGRKMNEELQDQLLMHQKIVNIGRILCFIFIDLCIL